MARDARASPQARRAERKAQVKNLRVCDGCSAEIDTRHGGIVTEDDRFLCSDCTPTPANPRAKAEPLSDGQLSIAKGVLEPDHFLYEKNRETRAFYAQLFATISHLQSRLVAAERERDEAIAHDRVKVLRAEVDAWRAAASDDAYIVKTEHESFTGRVSFTEKTLDAINRLQAARDATDSLPRGDDNG